MGTTSRGTPVTFNRRAVEADHLIVTGTVVYHYFAGFGGGPKAILPGIAGVDTIAHNHALNILEDGLDPRVQIGRIEGNPVAEDIEEGAALLPVTLCINTTMNKQGKIASLHAGLLPQAHAAAIQQAQLRYRVPIQEQADLVIASCGPIPNFLQCHKGLYNAHAACKPTGIVILLAACPEGLGGEQLEKWLRLPDTSAILKALQNQSEINGQTALSIRGKAPRTILVTNLHDDDAALIGATRAADLSQALALARQSLGIHDPTYHLMPQCAYTVPMLQ